MPIPFFLALAGSGRILSWDDPSVVKDDAALDGTGGSAYAPFLVTAPVGGPGEWSTLRLLQLRVAHDSAVTVTATPRRDGNDTGQPITRVLALGAAPEVEAPFFSTGSEHQVKIELSAFTAPASCGPAAVWVVPRRTRRT